MSPAEKAGVSAELLEKMEARLRARRTQLGPWSPPSYGGLHEAAALLGWFEPDRLVAVEDARADRLDALLADCDHLVDESGGGRWMLSSAVRIATLRQLRERGRLEVALAQAAPNGEDLVHMTIAAYVQREGSPVESQELEQLAVTEQVCEWLREAGYAGLPNTEAIRRRRDWLTLLEPFEHLVRNDFSGRRLELKQLRAYVEVLPPESVSEATRRQARRMLGLHDRPPLVIYGPGGVGKSTLLARFILDHVRGLDEDRFPFAYLDFDRPDVNAGEPVALLVEAVRQLGIEYPQAQASAKAISQAWIERLAGGESLRAVRRSAIRDFATLIESIGAAERPVLLVLDTFEEVQWRSFEYVDGIWQLLEDLRAAVKRLRVCITGRAPVEGRRTYTLHLAGLDDDAAVGYLQLRGIRDEKLARRLVGRIGGNVLSLKLVADLAALDDTDAGVVDSAKLERRYLLRADDVLIQRRLYTRILAHIHDSEVRKLAHLALVLRRLTPELILYVLAEPCGLQIDTLAEAQRIFDGLRREVSLVTVADDGALHHRSDLRRVMLHLVEEDSPEQTRAIHQRAVAFYAQRGVPDPRERAEEVYHRLALGEPRDEIDKRWIDDVAPYLRTALTEFSGPSRAYLAGRLGTSVDAETLQLAELEDWERIVDRRAEQLLELEQPEAALKLLGERSERTPASRLYELEARANSALGRWNACVSLCEHGIDWALAHGNRRGALCLALLEAETVLAGKLVKEAAALADRVATLAASVSGEHEQLNALAHRVALVSAVRPPEDTLLQQLVDRVDATADQELRGGAALAWWVGASLRDVSRLARIVELSGLPRGNQSTLRRLAAAVAAFDRSESERQGAEPGVLARSAGLEVCDSLTGTWVRFLLTARDEDVRQVVADVLRTPSAPSEVVEELSRAYLAAATGSSDELQTSEPMQKRAGLRRPARLSGPQRRILIKLLTDVFPTQDALREFLRHRLDWSLDAMAPTDADLRSQASDVARHADMRGQMTELVDALRNAAPTALELHPLLATVGLSTIVPDEETAQGLLHMHETVMTFRTGLAEIEGQVCTIASQRDTLGMGFLVGPDLVLTARHLVDLDIDARALRLCFDLSYIAGRGPSATNFTVEHIVARGNSTREGLDYALLRTHSAPGLQPRGGFRGEPTAELRRWVDLSEPFVESARAGEPVVFVHRERDAPLQVTLDEIVAWDPGTISVRYGFAGPPGSTGAPCFNMRLQLVALHWASVADLGIGVSTAAMVRDLRDQGYGDLLGRVFA